MVIMVLIRQTVLKHGCTQCNQQIQFTSIVVSGNYSYLFFMLFSDLLQNYLYIKLSLAILDVGGLFILI